MTIFNYMRLYSNIIISTTSHVHTCVCIYTYIYIYIYIYKDIILLRPDPPARLTLLGKGQMGLALMGALQISCFLTEGPFGYPR